MIRLQHTLPELRSYEIPISCGAGFDRHTVTTVKRTLVRAGEGAIAGSMDIKATARSATRNFPRSITLTAAGTKGDTSEELPDNVQHVEPFKRLIERGALRVINVPAAASETAQETAVPTATSSDGPKGESDKPADAGAPEITTTTRQKKRGGEQ